MRLDEGTLRRERQIKKAITFMVVLVLIIIIGLFVDHKHQIKSRQEATQQKTEAPTTTQFGNILSAVMPCSDSDVSQAASDSQLTTYMASCTMQADGNTTTVLATSYSAISDAQETFNSCLDSSSFKDNEGQTIRVINAHSETLYDMTFNVCGDETSGSGLYEVRGDGLDSSGTKIIEVTVTPGEGSSSNTYGLWTDLNKALGSVQFDN
jgi:hypothetical protein